MANSGTFSMHGLVQVDARTYGQSGSAPYSDDGFSVNRMRVYFNGRGRRSHNQRALRGISINLAYGRA